MLGLTSLELPQLQRLRRALLRLGAARDARQRRPVLPALPLGTVRRSVQEAGVGDGRGDDAKG